MDGTKRECAKIVRGRMGSAGSEEWFRPHGRRAAWNLSAPRVGPSLFGMSAYRTCTLGLPGEYATGERKSSRDVCLSVTGHPVTERYSLDAACLPLHHAAGMFRNLRQPALLLQFCRPSLQRAVTAVAPRESAAVRNRQSNSHASACNCAPWRIARKDSRHFQARGRILGGGRPPPPATAKRPSIWPWGRARQNRGSQQRHWSPDPCRRDFGPRCGRVMLAAGLKSRAKPSPI